MRQILKFSAAALIVLVTLGSCSNGQSLQEYYVDNQENSDFMLIDVPMSLVSGDIGVLDKEQQSILKTVRKINIMAYPLKESTTVGFDGEKAKLMNILAGDDYEELMKANSDNGNMRLYFKGTEEAIDEVIFFGSEDSKGFVLARLLGDDMNIGDMMRLAQSMEAGDIDVSQFEGVMDVFNDLQ